jgi:hypothetical protein
MSVTLLTPEEVFLHAQFHSLLDGAAETRGASAVDGPTLIRSIASRGARTYGIVDSKIATELPAASVISLESGPLSFRRQTSEFGSTRALAHANAGGCATGGSCYAVDLTDYRATSSADERV